MLIQFCSQLGSTPRVINWELSGDILCLNHVRFLLLYVFPTLCYRLSGGFCDIKYLKRLLPWCHVSSHSFGTRVGTDEWRVRHAAFGLSSSPRNFCAVPWGIYGYLTGKYRPAQVDLQRSRQAGMLTALWDAC